MLAIYPGDQKIGGSGKKSRGTQEEKLESMQQKVETNKLNMTMFSPEKVCFYH